MGLRESAQCLFLNVTAMRDRDSGSGLFGDIMPECDLAFVLALAFVFMFVFLAHAHFCSRTHICPRARVCYCARVHSHAHGRYLLKVW